MSGPFASPVVDTLPGQVFPVEAFPNFPSNAVSPHLVGFWTLGDQQYCCAHDYSGKHNHFYRLIQLLVRGVSGWAVNGGGYSYGGRVSANPLDTRFDITAPGVSFIAAWQSKVVAVTGTQDQWILGKGAGGGGPSGSIGLGLDMIDHSAGVPRFRYVLNNVAHFSSDFATIMGTAWSAGTIYHLAAVRDSSGAMGPPNQLYFYVNGIRDTALDSVGYVAYAPTIANSASNLALFDAGPAITGTDMNNSGTNGYNLANLQLALLQPNIPLPGAGTPAAMDALIAKMAANPTYMLQEGDLP